MTFPDKDNSSKNFPVSPDDILTFLYQTEDITQATPAEHKNYIRQLVSVGHNLLTEKYPDIHDMSAKDFAHDYDDPAGYPFDTRSQVKKQIEKLKSNKFDYNFIIPGRASIPVTFITALGAGLISGKIFDQPEETAYGWASLAAKASVILVYTAAHFALRQNKKEITDEISYHKGVLDDFDNVQSARNNFFAAFEALRNNKTDALLGNDQLIQEARDIIESELDFPEQTDPTIQNTPN